MPKGLLSFEEPEINYVAARGDDSLYFAVMNQSSNTVSAILRVDGKLVSFEPGKKLAARVWQENQPVKSIELNPAEIHVEIAPNGITALAIAGLKVAPKFQTKLVGSSPAWKQDFAKLDLGGTHAMLLNFGPELKSAYVYLQANATEVRQATLHYSTGGEWHTMTDDAFPFEFTVPVAADASRFDFKVETISTDGVTNVSPVFVAKYAAAAALAPVKGGEADVTVVVLARVGELVVVLVFIIM